MAEKKYGLTPIEHLKGIVRIATLFESGTQLFVYPLKVNYRQTNSDREKPLIKVMFSVPKRRHHFAVDRNLLKRRMREAYRLRKNMLLGILEANQELELSFSYVSDGFTSQAKLNEKMEIVLNKLINDIKKKS